MKVACEIFENHKLHYWLDFGSLLGIIRYGELIDCDHDIDYGIFLENLPILEKAKNDLAKAGYTLCSNRVESSSFPRIYHNNEHLADIWLWHEPLNDGYLKIAKDERSPPKKINNLKIPKPFFKNISYFTWQGIQIPIPSYVEQYLQFRYGFNWRIQDEHFYDGKQEKIWSEQIKIMEKIFKIKENVSTNFESWSDWDIKKIPRWNRYTL